MSARHSERAENRRGRKYWQAFSARNDYFYVEHLRLIIFSTGKTDDPFGVALHVSRRHGTSFEGPDISRILERAAPDPSNRDVHRSVTAAATLSGVVPLHLRDIMAPDARRVDVLARVGFSSLWSVERLRR